MDKNSWKTEESKSYRFGTTWGWVNDDSILILNPLTDVVSILGVVVDSILIIVRFKVIKHSK